MPVNNWITDFQLNGGRSYSPFSESYWLGFLTFSSQPSPAEGARDLLCKRNWISSPGASLWGIPVLNSSVYPIIATQLHWSFILSKKSHHQRACILMKYFKKNLLRDIEGKPILHYVWFVHPFIEIWDSSKIHVNIISIAIFVYCKYTFLSLNSCPASSSFSYTHIYTHTQTSRECHMSQVRPTWKSRNAEHIIIVRGHLSVFLPGTEIFLALKTCKWHFSSVLFILSE